MADTTSTPAAPVKAAPTKRTMAPAARDPEGADNTNRALQSMAVARLQALRVDIDRELRRRAAEPGEPSFGVSAGTQFELDERERRVAAGEDGDRIVVASPFTGRPLDDQGEPIADEG